MQTDSQLCIALLIQEIILYSKKNPKQTNKKNPPKKNPTTGGERKGQLYKDAITVEGAKLQHGELFKQPR